MEAEDWWSGRIREELSAPVYSSPVHSWEIESPNLIPRRERAAHPAPEYGFFDRVTWNLAAPEQLPIREPWTTTVPAEVFYHDNIRRMYVEDPDAYGELYEQEDRFVMWPCMFCEKLVVADRENPTCPLCEADLPLRVRHRVWIDEAEMRAPVTGPFTVAMIADGLYILVDVSDWQDIDRQARIRSGNPSDELITTESVAAVVDDIQTRLDRMVIDALLGTSTEAVGGQQSA